MSQADTPTAGFRPFFNPATGEWITYTAIAADNDGQLVRFSWRSMPGGVITEHVHPHQEERFTILAATMSGSALAVTTGIAAGVILLGTAAAGFHDLAGLRPARRPGPASPGTKG